MRWNEIKLIQKSQQQLNIMLFIANRPTHLLITDSRRVILTTQNQIIHTQLDFIEEFLAAPLTHPQPTLLSHSQSSSESLVACKGSLQLYWTDWQQRLELRLLIILNQEIVHSIFYSCSWFAYGNFKQYGSKKLYLCQTDTIDQELLSCYVGSKQFIVSNTKLILYQHKNRTRKYLEWSKSKQYIAKIHLKKPTLKGCMINSDNYLIQAGRLMIYLNGAEVLHCMEHEGDLVVSGKIAAWFNFGKMKIFQIGERQIHNLGEVPSFDGHYYGSIIQKNKIFMLFYDFKELMVKVVNLVSEQANAEYQKKQAEKSKLRSYVIAEKHHTGHQQISCQSLANLIEEMVESNKQCYSPSRSSVSKNNIRKTLKQSILKFQEQFNRSLSQQEKFNDEVKQNKASNYHELIRELKTSQMLRSDSLQQKKHNQQNQLSKNTAFQQGKSKFEQINDIHQHSSNITSSNIVLHQCAETPVFQHLEHNISDNWGSLANAWPNASKIEAIKQIKQELDCEMEERKQSEVELKVDNSNQSSCMEIVVVQEELNSPRVVRSSNNSRRTEEQSGSQFKLAEVSNKEVESIITETLALKTQENKLTEVQKPVQSRRAVLNSRVFTNSQNQESASEQKQAEPEKNKPQSLKSRRSFKGKMLTVQTRNINKELNLPSSPLLKKYSFNIQNSSQNNNAYQEEDKVRSPTAWIYDSKQNKKKATQILRDIYKRSPEKFEEALQKLVYRVISEQEASLFFTEYVRIFNPNLTKDRLLRLYRHIEDNQENRISMTKALKEFKLEEVPTICLSFNRNLIGVFRAIYQEVYIEDLLQPSIRLYEAMLQSYFSQNFDRVSLKIQDEIIALAYPRNLLNVLLFLNEHFNLAIQQVFEAFTKKMLKYQQHEIISKIANSDIPKLCKIDNSLFGRAAEKVAKEILEQDCNSYQKIESVIQMMDYKTQKIFKLTINLIQQFNLSSITFDIHSILQLPHSNCSYNILKDLIKINSAESLVKINLPQVIKLLNWLQKGKKQSYYTEQGIQITKCLVKKLLQHKFYVEAIASLIPIAAGLKRSYLAAVLLHYFQGRFANRLSNFKIYNQADFLKVFNDLLIRAEAKGDKMPQNVSIHSTTMKWSEFRQICKENFNLNTWQLCYLIYTDQQLAYELIQESIFDQEELNQLFRLLGTDPSKYKFVKFLDRKSNLLQIPLGSESSQDSQSEDIRPSVIQDKEQKRKAKFELSFKLIKSLDSVEKSKQKLCRSMLENSEETDPVLFDLKFTVTSEESLQILREHYKKSSIEQFFQALKLVDKHQLGIITQNVEIFKAINNLNIELSLKQIIPFEYFFNLEEAWILVKPFIRREVSIDNFWVYYLAVQILYNKVDQIVQFFIDRLIADENDRWASGLQTIFSQVILPKQIRQEKYKRAEKKGLTNLKKVLRYE